jgi:hypothetical protein
METKEFKEQVYATMQNLAREGVTDFDSTRVRDRIAGEQLEAQTGDARGHVRRAMAQLVKEERVMLERRVVKGKTRFIYKLKG